MQGQLTLRMMVRARQMGGGFLARPLFVMYEGGGAMHPIELARKSAALGSVKDAQRVYALAIQQSSGLWRRGHMYTVSLLEGLGLRHHHGSAFINQGASLSWKKSEL